jgi:hypothetical protein
MKYATEMGSGAMIHTKFHKDWFRPSEVDRGEHRHRQHNDLISLLLFFKIRKEDKIGKFSDYACFERSLSSSHTHPF